MDGSNRLTLVSSDIKWPNGLTLDLVQRRVYWVDGKLNHIGSVDFDGRNRKLVLQSPESLPHPFSITTFEDELYWTDWGNQTLYQANKFDGSGVKQVLPERTVSQK